MSDRIYQRLHQQHHSQLQQRLQRMLLKGSFLWLVSFACLVDASSQHQLPRNSFVAEEGHNTDETKQSQPTQQQRRQQLQRIRYPERNLRGNERQRNLNNKSSGQGFIFAGNEAFSNIYSLTQFSFPTNAPTYNVRLTTHSSMLVVPTFSLSHCDTFVNRVLRLGYDDGLCDDYQP